MRLCNSYLDPAMVDSPQCLWLLADYTGKLCVQLPQGVVTLRESGSWVAMEFLGLSWLPRCVFSIIRLPIENYRAFNWFAVEKSSKIWNGLYVILPHIIEANPKFSPPFCRWKGKKKLTHRDEKFTSYLLSVSGGIGDGWCNMRNCLPNSAFWQRIFRD